MAKKKFYISDIPSVTNALNIMTSTYDKEFKVLNKTVKRLSIASMLIAGYMYLNNKVIKVQNKRINKLEAELTNLKTPKEGNMEPEGE